MRIHVDIPLGDPDQWLRERLARNRTSALARFILSLVVGLTVMSIMLAVSWLAHHLGVPLAVIAIAWQAFSAFAVSAWVMGLK